MALSQLQCLDDNHVNPRTTESKPEFQYCEDQRLALETLLADGRVAFAKFLEQRGLRGFLSDPEQDVLTREREPFDPDTDLFPEGADENEPPLSQDYWPELSDQSVPRMDLGWPDSESYRGVTRTTVYAQPPQEGQAHVKEIVRKMIAQAQKVIAVVMDVFTDVDIFRDLLDMSFKKKVSVYILVERKSLPHFLSMCHRADMHAGHLKHLRVRCAGGREFYTRSCTKVCGRLGHRFMFIDGDKAVSGSYSFTWMSSRLDRSLITVVTGQAVDAFDRLFQCLYMASSHVDLQQAATKPEPAPEPIPQRAPVALPSTAIARKLHNPKYSLVFGTPSPGEAASANQNTADQSQDKATSLRSDAKKGRRKKGHGPTPEALPLHPGLVDLEKAHLVEYLPTWPEPEPSSDVIGFINIVDTSRPTQVHLQRSERFGVSQAIKFSSPIGEPKGRPSEPSGPEAAPVQGEPLHRDVGAQNTPGLQMSEAEPKEESHEDSKTVTSPTLKSDICSEGSAPAFVSQSSTPATPKPETPPDTAPTDCSEPRPVHTEMSVMDTVLTQPDSANCHNKNCDPKEHKSPPEPSEKAGILPSSPPPSVTPPTPKPRTVHLLVKGGTGTGGLEAQNCVAELKSQPETGVGSLAGRDSSTASHSGEHHAEMARSEIAADPVGHLETEQEAQEQAPSRGLIGGHVTHRSNEDTQERPREQPIPSHTDQQNMPEDTVKDVDPKTGSQTCHQAPSPPEQSGGASEIQSETQLRMYQAKAHEPQVISYGGETNSHPSTGSDRTVTSHPTRPDTMPGADQDTQRRGTLATQATADNNQRDVKDVEAGRPQRPPLPEPERSPYTFRRISTPDGSRTPTPDSRTNTPDSGRVKPGIRTPTPVSDGYVSSKEDSTLSTTSDEYYECSDSLFNEWFFDRNVHRHLSLKDEPSETTACTNCTPMPPPAVPGKLENTAGKKVDGMQRRRNLEDPGPGAEREPSPKVTHRSPQGPKRKLSNSLDSHEDGGTAPHPPTVGQNSRKISSGAEWQVLIPQSPGKATVSAELEAPEGKQEQQRKDSGPGPPQQPRPPQPTSPSRLLSARTQGAQPQSHPVEMMILKNSAPPVRPPPPRTEGGRVDQRNQSKPSPASALLRTNMHGVRLQSQSKPDAEERKQEEGRAPFSITFGKLHKLTSLKDKKGKKSPSSPAEGRKSTS